MLALIKTLALKLSLVFYFAAFSLYHSDTSMCCNSVMQACEIGFLRLFFLQKQKNLPPPDRPLLASIYAIRVKCGAEETTSHCKFDSSR